MSRSSRHQWLIDLALAALIVVATFPDVIFGGVTISMLDIYNLENPSHLYVADDPKSLDGSNGRRGRPTQSLYPERRNRQVHHGFTDHGGAARQSEPMHGFMRHTIANGESPYWNPYSGTGALGPETLVDIKFSPLTLLNSVAGGTITTYHIIVLSLYVICLFALIRTLRLYFDFGVVISLAVAVVYWLNGFNVAYLNSNVTQTLLYFPLLLFALCAFARKPTTLRWVVVVLANLPVMLTTFLPTTALVLISAYSIAAAFTFAEMGKSENKRWSQWLKIVTVQASAAVLAFLVLAFLYFPIIESFTVVDTLSVYTQRVFHPANLSNLLSFFTPKHFWESYNAIDAALWRGSAPVYIGNVVFHFGIAASVVAAHAFRRWESFHRPIVIILAVLFFGALLRIFDMPGISHVVEIIPILGSIGEQYVWMVVGLTFPLLFGYGFQALWYGKANGYGANGICIIIVALSIYLYQVLGFPEVEPWSFYLDGDTSRLYVFVLVFVTVSAMVLTVLARASFRYRRHLMGLLILVVFAELTFYMHHLRFLRKDIFAEPPKYASFLKDKIGNYRIANFGPHGLPPELGSAYQIQQIGSFNMNVLPWYNRFFDRMFFPDRSEKHGLFPSLHRKRPESPINETALDLLAVKYVIFPSWWRSQIKSYEGPNAKKVFETAGITVFENLDHYPRMFVAPVALDATLELDAVGMSPRNVVFSKDQELLTSARRLAIPGAPFESAAKAARESQAEITQYGHARVSARVRLTRPGVVVLMDAWHPNWSATLDGKPVHIGLVNESFRGIAVPAGEHEIVMKYIPASLPSALVVTGCAVIFLFGLGLFRRRVDPWVANLKND